MKARFAYYMSEYLDRPEPIFRAPDGSSVGGDTIINRYGLPVPLFPSYETWLKLVAEKKRCGRCYAALRGLPDLTNHYANTTCGLWAKQKQMAVA